MIPNISPSKVKKVKISKVPLEGQNKGKGLGNSPSQQHAFLI